MRCLAGAHSAPTWYPTLPFVRLPSAGSMGSSRAWQPSACSRLCFALASLSCVVDSRVATGDWVMVAAFDGGLATLKRWFRKPGGWTEYRRWVGLVRRRAASSGEAALFAPALCHSGKLSC